MLNINRVVHPTDFSDGARAAFAHALHIARCHGATLDVMHASPLLGELPPGPDVGIAFYPEGYEALYRANQKESLRAYVSGADTKGAFVNVEAPMYGGNPADEILTYAKGADLIVMGTHGHRGIKRFFLGSVAEVVIRASECPVLTVQARPDGNDQPDQVRCILAAVDLTYYAEEVVRYAGALASLYDATLVLLNIVDGVTDPSISRLGFENRGRRLAELEIEARRQLGWLRMLIPDPLLPVSYHVASGFSLEEVPAAIERIKPDLVVCASHGFQGLDRMFMGSVTERIVQLGHRATLVIKPAGRDLLPVHDRPAVDYGSPTPHASL